MRSAVRFVFGTGFVVAIGFGIAYAPALVVIGLGALLVYISVKRLQDDTP